MQFRTARATQRRLAISAVKFAEQRGLRYIQDEDNNVIIFAPASAGMGTRPACHFAGTSGYGVRENTGLRFGYGNTRSALFKPMANGFGQIRRRWAAMTALSLSRMRWRFSMMPSIRKHPPLEVILTVDEEIGMLGAGIHSFGQIIPAAAVCSILIRSRRRRSADELRRRRNGILLDSDDVECQKRSARHGQDSRPARRSISGTDLDKGRANANVLLGRFLNELDKEYPYALCTVDGGLKDNAIPRESTADMIISPDYLEELCAYAAKTQNAWREEFGENDPEIAVSVQEIGIDSHEVMFGDCRRNTLAVMSQLPNGVQAMSQEIEGLVQTSLNLGILKTDFRGVHMHASLCAAPSMRKRTALMEQLADLMARYGGGAEINGEYPAWEYRKESKLRRIMTQVYTERYWAKRPEIEAIHAGLECGLLAGKLPDLDAISFGPDIEEIHTTRVALVHSVGTAHVELYSWRPQGVQVKKQSKRESRSKAALPHFL